MRRPPAVLIVDDEPEWQKRFARYVRAAELAPAATAGTADEAHLALSTRFFHVALVDLSLIGHDNRDGLAVLRRICVELNEGTQALLVTAYGDPEEGSLAKEYGAEAISKKRLDYEATVRLIRAAATRANEIVQGYHVGLSLFVGPGESLARSVAEGNITTMLGGDVLRIDSFARRVLRGLAPVLWHKQTPAEIQQAHGYVVARFWSRMHAEPYSAAIGRTGTTEAFLRSTRGTGTTATDTEAGVVRRIREHNLEGVVVRDESAGLESFTTKQDAVLAHRRDPRKG